VYRGTAAGGIEHKLSLPLTRLAPGVYFIKFTTTKGETVTQKIVKQ
jgi:hypothetical protein